jgi:hypothetical protein
MGQFTQKLDHFYRQLLKGVTLLPNVPEISYKDYSVWLSEFIKSEAANEHRNYWSDQLSGTHNVAYIAPDFIRTGNNSHQGLKFRQTLSAELTEQLQKLAIQQNSSLFTTLLAAFKTLLCKRSGNTDIVVGTIVSGREHPELESQVGNFMNLIPIRTELNENESFTNTIQQVSKNVLEAFDHRIYPFDQMLQDMKFSREPDRNPLFDYLFIFQNHQEAELKLEGVEVERLQSDPEHSKTDILFELRLTGNQVQVNIEYNTALYIHETMELLLNDFERLLESLASNPRQPLYDIEFGDKALIADMTTTFNAPIEVPSFNPVAIEFQNRVGKWSEKQSHR